MDLGIAGHVAVITGGGRGLGAEMAQALADERCRVVVWDRDASANDVTASITVKGGDAVALVGDVTRPDVVDRSVAEIRAKFDRVDILVNCAGYSRDAPICEMSDEQWAAVIDVNLTAPFLVSRAIVPIMLKQHYGRIVNISSRARFGDINKCNYAAAKAGVVGLTMALALELGKSGITVNAIAPGFCETERTRQLPYYKDLRSRALERTPTDRLGTERDVADGLLYLVGVRAGYITGEVLTIAGGRWR